MALPDNEKDIAALEPGASTVLFRQIRKSADGTLAGYLRRACEADQGRRSEGR